MRINEETVGAVILVILLFFLAILLLGCSLNGQEIRDCSIFRCCRRRSLQDAENENYSTLDEFVFETDAENPEQPGGLVDMVPTTMQQVFPDLLGEGGSQSQNDPKDSSSAGNDNVESQLSEPLLSRED